MPPTNYLLALGVVPAAAAHLVLYTDGWNLHLARFDASGFAVVPGSELPGAILGVAGGSDRATFAVAFHDFPRSRAAVYRWTADGWRALGNAEPTMEVRSPPASVGAVGETAYVAWSNLGVNGQPYTVHVKASDGVDWVEPWDNLAVDAPFAGTPELGNDSEGRLVAAWTQQAGNLALCRVRVKRLVQ